MANYNTTRYRTTKPILIPSGTNVVLITRMKQDVERTAMAIVRAGPDMHFEWRMFIDDALKAGLIEEVK